MVSKKNGKKNKKTTKAKGTAKAKKNAKKSEEEVNAELSNNFIKEQKNVNSFVEELKNKEKVPTKEVIEKKDENSEREKDKIDVSVEQVLKIENEDLKTEIKKLQEKNLELTKFVKKYDKVIDATTNFTNEVGDTIKEINGLKNIIVVEEKDEKNEKVVKKTIKIESKLESIKQNEKKSSENKRRMLYILNSLFDSKDLLIMSSMNKPPLVKITDEQMSKVIKTINQNELSEIKDEKTIKKLVQDTLNFNRTSLKNKKKKDNVVDQKKVEGEKIEESKLSPKKNEGNDEDEEEDEHDV